jgi:hypothetical protein
MKKMIYALLAIFITVNFAYAEKNVMITTRDGMMKQYTAVMAEEIAKPIALTNYGLKNTDIRPLIKGGLNLILAEESVYVRTLADTSDSAFIYPPNVNLETDPWTFTGWFDFPENLGNYGNSIGFGQFIPPLNGRFTIDSIYLPIFKISVWPNVTSDFAMLPITVPNEPMGQQTWTGFQFDIDGDAYQPLVDDYIMLNKDTINTRLQTVGGQTTILWYKVFLETPIVVNSGTNFGFVIVPTSATLRDTVRFLGGFEWQLPKEQTFGVHVRRQNNSDTVESIFRWYRTWQPPYSQTFGPLNGTYIRQNFDCIVWGRIETSVVERKGDAAPFNLEQNFPNPVSNTTNIKFSTENTSFVNLEVYNSMGQTVSQLVNSMMDAGTYSITFDSETLTPGTYFYTLRSGNTSITKTMSIVR